MEGGEFLMEIITGKQATALKIVVYGPEGIGKSTFASKFPRPVFIDTEGSTKHMEVARTPRPTSWSAPSRWVTSWWRACRENAPSRSEPSAGGSRMPKLLAEANRHGSL